MNIQDIDILENRPASRRKVDAMRVLDKDCRHWRVECDQDEALAFFCEARIYNEMTREGLIELAQCVDKQVPRVMLNEGNPNNGTRAHKWSIGNESSRVAYLTLEKFYVSETDFDELARVLCSLGKCVGFADEYTVHTNDDHELVIRFWWD
jgi:hypothetical protein